MRWALVSLVFLTACKPTFVLSKAPACESDFQSWKGGLTWHLASGQGSGAWDYDPEGAPVQNYGSYDFATGAFGWDVKWPDDTWIVWQEVRGTGKAWTDGDLDIAYTLKTFTRDDDVSTVEIRERRLGCDVEHYQSEDGDPEVIELGRFRGGAYEYERHFFIDELEAMTVGTATSSGYEEELEFTRTGYKLETSESGDWDGAFERTFDERQGATVREGTVVRSAAGVEEWTYTLDQGSTSFDYEYTVDGSGNGEGEVDYGSEDCEVVWEDGECSLDDCSKASREGPCPL
jgi:hypothetical protein